MENLKKNSGTKRLSLAKKKKKHKDTLKSTQDKQEEKFSKNWKLCLRKSPRTHHRKLKERKILKRNLEENEKLQHMIVI